MDTDHQGGLRLLPAGQRQALQHRWPRAAAAPVLPAQHRARARQLGPQPGARLRGAAVPGRAHGRDPAAAPGHHGRGESERGLRQHCGYSKVIAVRFDDMDPGVNFAAVAWDRELLLARVRQAGAADLREPVAGRPPDTRSGSARPSPVTPARSAAERWVCLDVGETLIDETRIWSTWADVLGIPRMTFMAAFGAVVARGQEHHDVFALLGIPDWRSRLPDVQRRYGGFQAVDLYPDALPAIAALRDAGIGSSVIGNQPAERTAELRALGVDAGRHGHERRDGRREARRPRSSSRALELMGDPDPGDGGLRRRSAGQRRAAIGRGRDARRLAATWSMGCHRDRGRRGHARGPLADGARIRLTELVPTASDAVWRSRRSRRLCQPCPALRRYPSTQPVPTGAVHRPRDGRGRMGGRRPRPGPCRPSPPTPRPRSWR